LPGPPGSRPLLSTEAGWHRPSSSRRCFPRCVDTGSAHQGRSGRRPSIRLRLLRRWVGERPHSDPALAGGGRPAPAEPLV
jgi:hypothetical protein